MAQRQPQQRPQLPLLPTPSSLPQLKVQGQEEEEEEEEGTEAKEEEGRKPPRPPRDYVTFPAPQQQRNAPPPSPPSFRHRVVEPFHGLCKSKSQIQWHFRLEWALLKHEWHWFLGFIVVEYLHLYARNAVFYIQGKVYHYPHDDPSQSFRKRHEQPPAHFPYPPLKDLGFMAFDAGHLLPQWHEWLLTFFVLALAGLSFLLVVARICLNMRFGGPKIALTSRDADDRRLVTMPMPVMIILKRMAMAGMVVIPLRCVTFLVTLVPPPAPYCQNAWSPPTSLEAIFNPFQSPRTGCGDQMFSGHTLHATLMMLVVWRYFPHHRLLPFVALASVLLLGFFLIVFQAHYTSDVIAAFYVTVLAWAVLLPEPTTLNQCGIRSSVRVRPADYMTAGTEPHRAEEIMQGLESGEGESKEEAKSSRRGEAGGEGEGMVAALCRRCCGRGRQHQQQQETRHKPPRITYLPPLPTSGPPLAEVEDHTRNEQAMERLPW